MSFEHGLDWLTEVDGDIIELRVRMGILDAERRRISEMQYQLEDIEKEMGKMKKQLVNLEEEREMILTSTYGEEML